MAKSNNEVLELLDQLFTQAKIRFGSVVKGRWFYDGESCPGCGKEIKSMKFKGQDAVSLNTFIYRDHGVLIAYPLCGKCARYIFKQSGTNPYSKSDLHVEIETNLKQAFIKQLGH